MFSFLTLFSLPLLSLSSLSLSSSPPLRPPPNSVRLASTRATRRARFRRRRSRRSRSRRSGTGPRRSRGSSRSSVSQLLFFCRLGRGRGARLGDIGKPRERLLRSAAPFSLEGAKKKNEDSKTENTSSLSFSLFLFPPLLLPQQVCSTSSTASRKRTSTSSRPTRAPRAPCRSSPRPSATRSPPTPRS